MVDSTGRDGAVRHLRTSQKGSGELGERFLTRRRALWEMAGSNTEATHALPVGFGDFPSDWFIVGKSNPTSWNSLNLNDMENRYA